MIRPKNIFSLSITTSRKGSALISALFITSLVAIAATAMSARLQLDIYRTHLTLVSDKLYLASQAVSFWAMSKLSKEKIYFNKADAQGKVGEFPKQYQRIYPEFTVEGSIYDLQARFNLNNLTDKGYYSFFLHLLNNTFPGLTSKEQLNLTFAIHQWISPYTPGSGNDDLINYYLQQTPPYYPGQALMQSISELRLIQGIDANNYRLLEKYVTALPKITPLNLNTAPPILLMGLGNGLNEIEVNELLTARAKKGIKKDEVNALLERLKIRNEQVTLVSEYFMSVAIVNSGNLKLINFSIIKRHKDQAGNLSVQIIRESLNAI